MQSNFPKVPLILSTTFFCVFLLAFIFFFRQINTNSHELELKESEWQREMLRREEVGKLDRSIRIIEEERKNLETHFAKSSDVVPFLDTMEGLAVDAGAKAETTSVDITDDKTTLTVGMKASGTWSSVYKFITLLENSPYEIEFVGMDMHKEAGADKWNVVIRIKLLSFMQ